MTDYAVGDRVSFAGGKGEIAKIEEPPAGASRSTCTPRRGSSANSRAVYPH